MHCLPEQPDAMHCASSGSWSSVLLFTVFQSVTPCRFTFSSLPMKHLARSNGHAKPKEGRQARSRERERERERPRQSKREREKENGQPLIRRAGGILVSLLSCLDKPARSGQERPEDASGGPAVVNPKS